MTLFWKVFLTLLLTLLATVGASAWLSQAWLHEHGPGEQHIHRLTDWGATAQAIYQREGKAGYRRWLHNLMTQQHMRGFLLDKHGNPILNRPIPAQLRPLAQQARHQHQRITHLKPPILAIATPLFSTPEMYWLAMTQLPAHTFQNERQTLRTMRLGIILLALLIISTALTRMFTRPIRTLQRQSEQLAQGQWDIPIAPALRQRSDELGDLARSFESMRATLHTLMHHHQQLLRDVSHELRSPLARLQVALELARHASQDTCSKELNRIEKEAHQLHTLIAEVLTLAQVQQQGAPHTQRLNATDIIQDVVHDAIFEAKHLGKHIHFQHTTPCWLNADALWLSRALDNVIRNALHHAHHQVSIHVHATHQHTDIYIQDDGTGVDKKDLPHLFKPFFRAEHERSGYGLGLAIAQRAIKQQGGSIEAQNHDEGGLSIHIRL